MRAAGVLVACLATQAVRDEASAAMATAAVDHNNTTILINYKCESSDKSHHIGGLR
jgi:hypothetical protein